MQLEKTRKLTVKINQTHLFGSKVRGTRPLMKKKEEVLQIKTQK